MKIGIDMDAVVADMMTPLIDFCNIKYNTKTKLSDHNTYAIETIWNCTEEEAIERCFEFFRSDSMNLIKPIKGAIEGVELLSNSHELHIITSRPDFINENTNKWIEKHFPNKFKTINQTNQFSKKGSLKRKKSDICKELGVDLMIEDHLEYALDCASLNIKILLMDMPWNQTNILPKNIVRVYSWNEIVGIIDK